MYNVYVHLLKYAHNMNTCIHVMYLYIYILETTPPALCFPPKIPRGSAGVHPGMLKFGAEVKVLDPTLMVLKWF